MCRTLAVTLGIAFLVSCGQKSPPETGKPVPAAEGARATDTAGSAQSAFAYEILEHNTPISMHADSAVAVMLKVRNTSNRAWPMRGMIKTGCYWTDEKGERVKAPEGRGLPQEEILPGNVAKIKVLVTPPAAPGTYFLTWDMVEEHVVWFGNRGAVPLKVAITVS